MTTVISIAMIAVLLLSLLILIFRRNQVHKGELPAGLFAFTAILFTSGLDVGLIMFPLTEFPTYAAEAAYGFTNPLAMAFGSWAFLVWIIYFVTTFYFAAIEPKLQLFEVPLIKFINNIVIIATCAFTGFLFFSYLPDYVSGISAPARFGLVALVILLAVLSSTHIRYVKILSVASTWLFYGLILIMLIASGIGFSGLMRNLGLLADYFPNMHKFVTPISDYHQFYLYWWLAWSIMIGQFVARFLGGLKTWQLLLALLFLPSIPIALWFSVLYGYYEGGIEITPMLNTLMIGVGIVFVINSLDSLTRLYTYNLGITASRLGTPKYVALNFALLFGLVLLYRYTPFQIEWVGLIVIGLFTIIGLVTLIERKRLESP